MKFAIYNMSLALALLNEANVSHSLVGKDAEANWLSTLREMLACVGARNYADARRMLTLLQEHPVRDEEHTVEYALDQVVNLMAHGRDRLEATSVKKFAEGYWMNHVRYLVFYVKYARYDKAQKSLDVLEEGHPEKFTE